ncbi:MAG: hypothetical protein M3O09_12715 [Acidobacteriota bacterium]|nr:hypothetical protein [Acidobacteriota bacterium]
MEVHPLYRVISAVMLLVLPSSLIGETTDNAMLKATGSVTINGSAIPQSSTIFVGDKIETQKQSTAMIFNAGMSVQLPSDSSVVYKENDVELMQGSALITTKKVTGGHLANLSISPVSSGATKFALVKQPGVETIAAIEGPVRVTDGRGTVVLKPGQGLKHDLIASNLADSTGQDNNAQGQTSTSEDSEKEKKKKKRKGPPPAAYDKGIRNWEVVALLAGGIIVPIAGTLIYDQLSGPGTKKPVSPTKP